MLSTSSQSPVMLTISSLPNELLVAIAAAGQYVHDPYLETPFNLRSEWIWSQVSSRFREAIIGAPTLWTLVEVNLDAEGSVEVLKLYLERSRTCDISAHFKYITIGADSKRALAAADRLRLIVPHIHRIWRLGIKYRKEWSQLLAPLQTIAAPNLQHLEIFNTNYASPGYQPSLVEIFSAGAPRLTIVNLNGFRLATVPLYAASLTHLELRGRQGSIDTDDGDLLLAAQCPLLVHFYLDIGRWFRFTAGRRFCLPSLKLLRISLSGGTNKACLGVFDVFDTPVLTEFIIVNAHGDQILTLLTSMCSHSFPALTSLCCVTQGLCSCEAMDISEMIPSPVPPIQHFPLLSSLTLINLCFTKNLIDEVFSSATQPWSLLNVTLCPQPLSLEGVDDALQKLVRSKGQHGDALPHFKLSVGLLSSMEDGMDTEMFDPTEIIDTFC